MTAFRRALAAIAVLLLGLRPQPAWPDDLATIRLMVDSLSTARGYSNLVDAVSAISSTGRIQAIIPSYNENSELSIRVSAPGYVLTETSPAGSPAVSLSGCGQTVIRNDGSTRDANLRAFKDDFTHGRLTALKQCAASSVNDGPFGALTRGPVSDMENALQDSGSGFGLDARFGSFSAGGYRSNDIVLPLDYTWELSPRDKVQLDVPISVTEVQGGKSYGANVGLLWRHQVFPRWRLQPSFHIGAVGSYDLAVAGAFWSVGLTSVATFDLPASSVLEIANGLTYIRSLPISIAGYNLDQGLSNVVFRNGVLFSRDLRFRLFNLPVRGSLFAFDTRYAGTATSIRYFDELGFFLTAAARYPVRLGATYLFGDRGLQGFTVNTGVRF